MYFFMPSIAIGIQSVHTQQGYIKIAAINSALLIGLGLITIGGSHKFVNKSAWEKNCTSDKLNLKFFTEY